MIVIGGFSFVMHGFGTAGKNALYKAKINQLSFEESCPDTFLPRVGSCSWQLNAPSVVQIVTGPRASF